MKLLQKSWVIAYITMHSIITNAQPDLNKKIALNAGERDLEYVLDEISKITNITIAYSNNHLPYNYKVQVPTKEMSIKEALELSLRNTGLTYTNTNDQIIILRTPSRTKKVTVSGYIKSDEGRESLIGANVYSINQRAGTSSNNFGFYSLTLPTDSAIIQYSFVGHEKKVIELNLMADTIINVNLQPVSLQEVVVYSSYGSNTSDKTTTTSHINLAVERIESMPAFFGEVDVMKAIQFLPGVQSGMEGSAAIYVRGGGPDQNLILMDGVPVYNASHLFGFFSVFNSDAINNVDLYKGGFPARYGGRLSSVIDITTKEGNNQSLKGEGSIGLIASRLTLEGPIKNEKTSFLVSARRTYIDALARPVMSIVSPHRIGYYFYDLNGKINHRFSNKDRIFLSAYLGNDKLRLKYNDTFEQGKRKSDEGIKWGNVTSAFRWNHIFTSKLFSNFIFTYSTYHFDYFSKLDQKFTSGPYEGSTLSEDKYTSGIRDWSFRPEFEFFPNPNHSIRFGGQAILHKFSPGATRQKQINQKATEVDTVFNGQSINTLEFALYAEDDISITEKFKTNLGVHASGYSVKGTFYKSLQPRVSFKYLLKPEFSLKASLVTMTQYIHLLTNSGIGMPTDLWLPATSRVKPQTSIQAVAGITKGYNSIELTIEGYYKKMENVIEYAQAAGFFEVEKDWESKIESGKGDSYGAEFLLHKKTGRLTGWVGYTISKTERQFKSINNGKRFPYKYDRRHDIDLTVSYQLKPSVQISGNWNFGTGNAVTLPVQKYTSAYNIKYPYIDQLYEYNGRNNHRMKSIHRMDLSISFSKQKKWGERKWVVSLYNVYSRLNPLYYYVSSDIGKQGKKTIMQYSLFPIIPSISYNFKF